MSRGADYVIVGGGTAGCVLAARLSEDPDASVVLLELGATDHGIAERGALQAPTAAQDFGYTTVAQPGLNGRAVPIARGRLLGGSSAINALLHVRGNRRDFDAWRALGNRGWGYEDLLPYFKRSETYYGPPSVLRGRHGPVSVIDCREPSPVSYAFVAAAAARTGGLEYNDFNGECQEAGPGFYQSTRTPDGERVTAASAFITPISTRPNLRVMTGARATRVLIERSRAVGVQYLSEGRAESIRAAREVVLCCGAFETPKLMLLSGLGGAEPLRRLGIDVVVDLPGVGDNLQDHLMLGVGFASRLPLDAPELLAEAGLFCWTDGGPRSSSPDLQFFFGPLQFVAEPYRTDEPGFTFAPIVVQPRSRGRVSLASTEPSALARVDPRYLSAPEDLAVLCRGVAFARELAHSKPFDAFRGRELAPGPHVIEPAALEDYARSVATTVWHPAGTCKMGADRLAVVDQELRVHGVEQLRIADASVMPSLVCGNPNAAVMMIAERAAALIAARPAPARHVREPREALLGTGQASRSTM
jgi:choline dehydrogenase